MEKTDQQLAEEIIINYLKRGRDAKNVEVIERLEDEKDWIFKVSYLSPDGKGKYINNLIKIPLGKKSGSVGNSIDIRE